MIGLGHSVFGVMREEANPRNPLRRAVDYGASQTRTSFSRAAFRQTTVAPLRASHTVPPLKSSKSVLQPTFLFRTNGANKISATPVTPSIPIKAPYLFKNFERIFHHRPPRLLRPTNGASGRFFPSTSARAI